MAPGRSKSGHGRRGPRLPRGLVLRIMRDAATALIFAGVVVGVGLTVIGPAGATSPGSTASPSASAVAVLSTPSSNPTLTPSPTSSPGPSFNLTPTPPPTLSPTPSPSPTFTPIPTPTLNPTPTVTPTPTPTPSPTPAICGLTNPPSPTAPPLPAGAGYVRFLIACDLNADGNPRGELDANEGPLGGVAVTMKCVDQAATMQTSGADGSVTFQPGGGADCTFAFTKAGWDATASYPSLPLPIRLASVYAGITSIQVFLSPQ